MRDRVKVYGWIGGDKPSDVYEGAKARKEQGFTAVKMNGTGMLLNPLLFPFPSFSCPSILSFGSRSFVAVACGAEQMISSFPLGG